MHRLRRTCAHLAVAALPALGVLAAPTASAAPALGPSHITTGAATTADTRPAPYSTAVRAGSRALLRAGGSLDPGESLRSANGRYRATMQRSGNFVVSLVGQGAIWASRTGGHRGARLVHTTSGKILVRSRSGSTLWSSRTARATRTILAMQDDGNLVLYSRGYLPLWASRGGRTGIKENIVPGAGHVLRGGQSIWSRNGRYRATMHDNGSFAVHEVGEGVIWRSGTSRAGSALGVQKDGNVVIYGPGSDVKWATGTWGRRTMFAMQDDGNLVHYSRGGIPLWASRGGRTPFRENTMPEGQHLIPGQALWAANGAYFAWLNPTGEFAVHKVGTGTIWSTRTTVDGSKLHMQGDGNLVLRSPAGAPLWHSATTSPLNTRVIMQDDGNLVIYDAADKPLWASKG